ncbi:Retrotransposon protein, partial [Globisporangium splendens]
MAASYSSISLAPAERKTFINSYRKDKEFRDAWENQDSSDKFVKMDELLYLRTQNSTLCLCVPDDYQLRTKFVASFHDPAIAAHPGIHRTFLRIVQWYYWKSMERDIHDYVSSCETCARWKHSNAKKNGKLIPIPIPEECWEVVSMGFITGLPESNGFDAIFTVVDKLSK